MHVCESEIGRDTKLHNFFLSLTFNIIASFAKCVVPVFKTRHHVSQLLSWYKGKKIRLKIQDIFSPFSRSAFIQDLVTLYVIRSTADKPRCCVKQRRNCHLQYSFIGEFFVWIFLRKKVFNETFFSFFLFLFCEECCCFYQAPQTGRLLRRVSRYDLLPNLLYIMY